MSQTLLLRLNLEVELKHAVTDSLLTFEALPLSFISYQVQSHQADQRLHSIREQVDGFTPKMMIEITVPEGLLNTLLQHLKAHLPQANIPYQILPSVQDGQL